VYFPLDKLLQNIDKQIEFNKGKNLFFNETDFPLKFIHETTEAIENSGGFSDEDAKLLIDYSTNKALDEFCRINQYFSFNRQSKAELREIYSGFITSIRNKTSSAEALSKTHYQNLKLWLQKSNPFAAIIYSNEDKLLKPVPCSEYTAELQIDILRIDLNSLIEPVLDIGCGKKGELVKRLKASGFEAYGLDRLSFDCPDLIEADWLEFDYEQRKWGTILSNLGFSNHFNHHHLRNDGNYIGYAKKYMKILESLKINGSFHYAPDLPFVEHHLSNAQFSLAKYEIGELDWKTTIVTRLK
jgi:hypothetical protein